MKVFDHYAQYYDLLYSTKDYAREVEYLCSLFSRMNAAPITILDLGCGTGNHDFLLVERGYHVTGIDRSPQMIALANEKKRAQRIDRIQFAEADIRALNLDYQFDAVISLFHVMNYLTEANDLSAGFENALQCLAPGGLLIFDSWYGPAVLSDLPKVTVRRFENEEVKVTRLAEPILHPNRNVVDVNYEISVRQKSSGRTAVISETHAMRYFFKTEIQQLFRTKGVDLVLMEEWRTAGPAGLNTFSVCFVGQKRMP